MKEVWILMSRNRKTNYLLVLCYFPTKKAAEDFATDSLGLGTAGFHAYRLDEKS
jgi:hypothetical protein